MPPGLPPGLVPPPPAVREPHLRLYGVDGSPQFPVGLVVNRAARHVLLSCGFADKETLVSRIPLSLLLAPTLMRPL